MSRKSIATQIEQTYGLLPEPMRPGSFEFLCRGMLGAPTKDDEKYLFVYADDQIAEVLRVFGRFATNCELSFSWYDAAVLSQQVRKRSGEL